MVNLSNSKIPSPPLPPTLLLPLLLPLLLLLPNAAAEGQIAGWILPVGEATEWPPSSVFAFAQQEEFFMFGDGIGGDDEMSGNERRSLFWHRIHHYISYAALSANRVPCPPRSGRSYYTHNCYMARGPVRPYSRNCETITLCRR